MPRTAGLRGRLPAKPVGDRFALGWVHQYLAQPLPAPQYPVDVTGGIGPDAWGMLGNGPDPTCTTHPDGVGDCTFAGREHYKRSKAAAGQEVEQWKTSNELVAEYLSYDHGQDEGANIADLLLFWYTSGKLLAFAPVDHTDPVACDAAMAAFHGLYAGVDLTDDADQLFEEGEPWSVGGGQQPDPADGHCIVKVGARGGPVETPGGSDTWVTWGALQRSSLGWTAACLSEAWVLVTQEDADAAGLDIAKLRADIDALGGTGGDTPARGALDPRSLLSEVAALVREVAAVPERTIAEVVAWFRSHGL
jgi:hypothetical protein